MQVGSPDEVAYLNKWITKEQISSLSKKFGKNSYGNYLGKLDQ
jgi:glucose-1-phosphate thymidylyltransferase